MAKDLFSSLDLNLLRTFLILSQERNMRRAAERLFVSQPAVSQALQKLRRHFGDELFVKVPQGLKPTPFSEELFDKVSSHLLALERAINGVEAFDPGKLDRKLRIALSPPVMACLSGALYARVRAQAPSCELELVRWSHSTLEELTKGTTLLGINYDVGHSKEVFSKPLLELTGRVFVRRGHPITKSHATPEDFDGYQIASLLTPGWNDDFSMAAEVMKRKGIDSKVGFRSEMVMALVDVLQHSDMYMPHSNLFPIGQYPMLRAIDVSDDGQPYTSQLFSYCHQVHRRTPLFDWLHQLILEVLEDQAS